MVTSLCNSQDLRLLGFIQGDPPAYLQRRAAGPAVLSPSSAGQLRLARLPARCPEPSYQPQGSPGRPARPLSAACPRCCGDKAPLARAALARAAPTLAHNLQCISPELHPEEPGSQVQDMSAHKDLSVFSNVSKRFSSPVPFSLSMKESVPPSCIAK